MLGHRLVDHLSRSHEVTCTLRQDAGAYAGIPLFTSKNTVFGVNAASVDTLATVFRERRPEAVINCIGIVKQRDDAKQALASIEINALFPHRLALLCGLIGARLIHVSTDCVFSGAQGMYTEADPSDAYDLYGRSKLLGEVGDEGCLTLRTSIIGHELSRKTSLLEWFLAQRGEIRGFTNAIFSGFTTLELSRIIERMLVEHPSASGLYHVSSEPISKYDLLRLFRERFGTPVEIQADPSFHCDRSLDSSRFRAEFGYAPPTWEQMVAELAPVGANA